MNKIILAALVASAALTTAAPASARGGCGVGFHPGPHGRCWPNRAGGYYRGYGYWHEGRYWQHRDRWHGGWRYR